MTRNTHPVEVLLLGALLALEAAAVLLAATLALLLTLAQWRPQQRPEPQEHAARQKALSGGRHCSTAPPALHPLAALAEGLQATCTRRQLQALAGTRTNLSKARLAALAVAC